MTYSQDMEEPGNLDIESFNVVGNPKGGDAFMGSDAELEYGVTAWWTTEFYLDGKATSDQSTIFTGFRWENRVRPWMGEHWINPVLYAELEDTSADKTLREVVGHDGNPDMLVPNGLARLDKEREIELKLILGSNVRGWNISENFITEKNFQNGDPWEFGYALGVSRPLKLAASAQECIFCPEKFQAEPNCMAVWAMPKGSAQFYFAVFWTDHQLDCTQRDDDRHVSSVRTRQLSIPFLFRFSISYEIEQVFSRFHR